MNCSTLYLKDHFIPLSVLDYARHRELTPASARLKRSHDILYYSGKTETSRLASMEPHGIACRTARLRSCVVSTPRYDASRSSVDGHMRWRTIVRCAGLSVSHLKIDIRKALLLRIETISLCANSSIAASACCSVRSRKKSKHLLNRACAGIQVSKKSQTAEV